MSRQVHSSTEHTFTKIHRAAKISIFLAGEFLKNPLCMDITLQYVISISLLQSIS